jgi:uncharacterized protein YbjT (DUF2867 family)
MNPIFITGGTGYIGSRLVRRLVSEGHEVYALARKGSEHKLHPDCTIMTGNALDAETYKYYIPTGCTFIHLIGVAHPSPKKKEQFQSIDLVSIQQAIEAAKYAGAVHFIYLSVAQHPTRIMADYQEVRRQGEELLKLSNLSVTFIRPWYVLGPGHWWPVLIKPVYWLMKLLPSTRGTAAKLDTVTIRQMINTLAEAVSRPSEQLKVYEVKDIKRNKD